MSGQWAGRKVTTARAYWLPYLPVPCARCKRPVMPDQTWHVGHVVDRWMGGPDDISNTWPEHAACNMSAGGKVGAQITNARRERTPSPTSTMAPERDRRIRGR